MHTTTLVASALLLASTALAGDYGNGGGWGGNGGGYGGGSGGGYGGGNGGQYADPQGKNSYGQDGQGQGQGGYGSGGWQPWEQSSVAPQPQIAAPTSTMETSTMETSTYSPPMETWSAVAQPPAYTPPAGGAPPAAAPATPPPSYTPPAGDLLVQVVSVADANGSLKYFPNSVQAPVGSIVQFQFHPKVCFMECSKCALQLTMHRITPSQNRHSTRHVCLSPRRMPL
jgi:hypothetical protein